MGTVRRGFLTAGPLLAIALVLAVVERDPVAKGLRAIAPDAAHRKRGILDRVLRNPDPGLAAWVAQGVHRYREELFPGDDEGWLAALAMLDERTDLGRSGISGALGLPARDLLRLLDDPHPIVRRIVHGEFRSRNGCRRTVGAVSWDFEPPPAFDPEAPEEARRESLARLRAWVFEAARLDPGGWGPSADPEAGR